MQFHILSFEGPDGYARAAASPAGISGLSEALAGAGFETHLWFVGDPHNLPAMKIGAGSRCTAGANGSVIIMAPASTTVKKRKRADYAASLPPFLARELLLPHAQGGGRAVVLAEEWQTVDALLHLDWLLRNAGVRDTSPSSGTPTILFPGIGSTGSAWLKPP